MFEIPYDITCGYETTIDKVTSQYMINIEQDRFCNIILIAQDCYHRQYHQKNNDSHQNTIKIWFNPPNNTDFGTLILDTRPDVERMIKIFVKIIKKFEDRWYYVPESVISKIVYGSALLAKHQYSYLCMEQHSIISHVSVYVSNDKDEVVYEKLKRNNLLIIGEY